MHQAVLRSFVQTGAAPGISSLATHAAPFDVADVLAELADGDFVCLDPVGQITAAYPFSALPTAHRVQISGHATVFAMCAIDALGVSAMTGLPVVIESADPATGEPVTVKVDGDTGAWDPISWEPPSVADAHIRLFRRVGGVASALMTAVVPPVIEHERQGQRSRPG